MIKDAIKEAEERIEIALNSDDQEEGKLQATIAVACTNIGIIYALTRIAGKLDALISVQENPRG